MSQVTPAGNVAAYTVNVNDASDFNGTVSLSIGGLSAGATASFNPASVNGSSFSTLSVTTSAAMSPGDYPFTLTGSSGSETHSVNAILTVNPYLPAGWKDLDVGPVGSAGGASYSAGTFTVSGSGSDIWNTEDQFNYVYQPTSDDQTIIARVVSQDNTSSWAKSGVMIRETATVYSSYVGLYVTSGNGINMQYRDGVGTGAVQLAQQTGVTAPYWIKLVRSGNAFTGYSSPDGVTWTQVGQTNVPMAAGVTAGLAVCAHNNSAINMSTFDNVSLIESVPGAPTGLTATAGDGEVTLNWSQLPGATSYNVKRATLNGGPYTTIASSTTATFTDTDVVNGQTYYYVVSALDTAGEGPESVQVTALPAAVPVIAHWSFDSGALTVSGGDITGAADSTGNHDMSVGANVGGANGVSGSLNSIPIPSSQSVPGEFGQGLTLTGNGSSGNFLTFPNLTELMAASSPTGYTISLWVKTSSSSISSYASGLADWGNASSGARYTYTFGLYSSTAVRAQARYGTSGSDNIYYQTPTATVSDGQWHMLTWTFDALTGVFDTYEDGSLLGTVTSSAPNLQIQNGSSSVGTLGLKADTAGFINGSITFDEIWVLGGVLDTNQIADLYRYNSLAALPANRPRLTHLTVFGNELFLTATNGVAGSQWTLLQSTQLALPLSQWQTNRIVNFDANGNLSTNILATVTNAQTFYILKQ